MCLNLEFTRDIRVLLTNCTMPLKLQIGRISLTILLMVKSLQCSHPFLRWRDRRSGIFHQMFPNGSTITILKK